MTSHHRRRSFPLSRLLSCGVWPALPLTGHRLLPPDFLDTCPLVTAFALWTLAGVVVWSVPLLAAAALRVYRPAFFGLAGWAVVAVCLLAPGSPTLPAAPWTTWDAVLAAGLTLAAVLYLGFPRETALEGNDMGVYANHAVFIARHGRLDIPYPWEGIERGIADDLQRHSPQGSGLFRNHVFIGFQKDGPVLTAEFGHVWPVWLAQAFATAGPAGLFRLNGAVGLLTLGAFYGLCLTVAPVPASVAITLFMALAPSQVWIVRTTLSEAFTQLAVCAGVLVLLKALKTGEPMLALWAGGFLSFSALIRCDSLLLLPLLLAAQLGQALLVQPVGRFDPVWSWFHAAALPGFLLAAVYFAALSRPYFRKQFFYLRLIGIASAGSAVALFLLPPLVGDGARDLLATVPAADVLGGCVALLAAYAYWVRPAVVSYRLNFPDHPQHGQHYRAEHSLRDLGRYLSPVALAAAVAGCWLALRDALGAFAPEFLPAIVIVAGYAGLYLYDPCDDPFHFWRVRRYVPVVIPGILLFAAVAGGRGLELLPDVWQGVVAGVAVVALVGFAVWRGAPFWWRAEDAGVWEQLRTLSELVPPDALVFAAGRPDWMMTLSVSFGRRIVPLDLDHDAGWELLARGVADQIRQGKTAHILLDNGRFLTPHAREIGRAVVFRQDLESKSHPVPGRFVDDEVMVVLFAIDGFIEPPALHRGAFGGNKVWGVTESGFHRELAPPFHHPLRHTNGHAVLEVPIPKGDWPDHVLVDVVYFSPNVGHLRVVVNGYELHTGPLSRRWFGILSMAHVPAGPVLTIEVMSTTWVPSDIFAGSLDDRALGVAVREVRLWASGRTIDS